MVNIEFKEYFLKNKEQFEQLPGEVQAKVLQKAKIRPYQKSVLKFREIMLAPISPLTKLFLLHTDLTNQINADITEFWADLLTDYSKVTLNRDELTSIMLFIISRAEVPDLMSQLRLMTEFTSDEVQDSSMGYRVSKAFSLIFCTVAWMSQLECKRLQEGDTR